MGNQGGIRAAAMLTFGLTPDAFVATSTAIGLVVDLARMPVYFFSQSAEIFSRWPLLVLTTVGVVLGTLIGTYLLARIPKRLFRRLVSFLILLLGVAILYKGAGL